MTVTIYRYIMLSEFSASCPCAVLLETSFHCVYSSNQHSLSLLNGACINCSSKAPQNWLNLTSSSGTLKWLEGLTICVSTFYITKTTPDFSNETLKVIPKLAILGHPSGAALSFNKIQFSLVSFSSCAHFGPKGATTVHDLTTQHNNFDQFL